jgi:hypothetical protein
MPNTPVCKLFEEKLKVQHFKIQKDKDPESENVGNSTIVPGKLEYVKETLGKGEEREGWMVVADE